MTKERRRDLPRGVATARRMVRKVAPNRIDHGGAPRTLSNNNNMSAEEVAKAFVQHYYHTFDSGGAQALASLYVSAEE